MRFFKMTGTALALTLAILGGAVQAADDASQSGRVFKGGTKFAQPEAGVLTFYTRKDNQDNAGSGSPDGDIRTYVCDGDYNYPIETQVLVKADPAKYGTVTLRIRAIDVDYDSGELSDVWVNGTFVGYLSGMDGQLSESVFEVPAGVAVNGRNLIQVGQTVSGWCNAVQAAAITLQ